VHPVESTAVHRRRGAPRKSQVRPEPPAAPFRHEDECETPDAVPEWSYVGDSTWERVCSCGTEHWHKPHDEQEADE
jgi:hypothetical protein